MITQPLYKNPLYWATDLALFLGALALLFLSARRSGNTRNMRGMRLRRSHRVARQRLRKSEHLLKKGDHDGFYAEISKALYDYFADKLNIPAQRVDLETIETGLDQESSQPQLLAEIRALFDELDLGRFASVEKSHEDAKRVYRMAGRVITMFERAKLK